MQQSEHLRTGALICLSALFVLLVGAVIFFKERMLFSDAAWIAFHTINSGTVQPQASRYGSFITHIFPVLAGKAGLSLKGILILYSISFNLFYFLSGYLLFRMKRYNLVILLTLFHTLFVSHAYFWTNNEVYQGVTWMFLMFGFIVYFHNRYHLKPIKYHILSLLIFIPLCFIAIYTHPLVLIPTLFLWVFFFADNSEPFFRTRYSIVYIVVLLAIVLFKIIDSRKNYYDGNILQNVFNANLADIIGTFTSGMADIFWKNLLTNHWIVAIIFLAGIFSLLRNRKYLQAVITVLASVSYFVVMCLTFSGGSKPYIESEWMCLAILATTPFVYNTLPGLKLHTLVAVLGVILIIRVSYIAFALPTYTGRIKMIETIVSIMKQKDVSKAIIVRTDNRLEDKSVIGWALPVETLFESVLANDTIQRTAICLSPEEIEKLPLNDLTRDIILPFSVNAISTFNHKYLRPDSMHTYKVFTYEEFFEDKIDVLKL